LLENFADSVSYNIKCEYFKAVLAKDATWFDAHNPNEMAGKISQESDMIQKGIGEKIGEVGHTVIVLIIGYILAFTIGWEFTLILLGAIPFLMIAAVIMAKSAQMGT